MDSNFRPNTYYTTIISQYLRYVRQPTRDSVWPITYHIILKCTLFQRAHDVIITSQLRQNDVTTSFWRNNNVIIAPRVRWNCMMPIYMTVHYDFWAFPYGQRNSYATRSIPWLWISWLLRSSWNFNYAWNMYLSMTWARYQMCRISEEPLEILRTISSP